MTDSTFEIQNQEPDGAIWRVIAPGIVTSLPLEEDFFVHVPGETDVDLAIVRQGYELAGGKIFKSEEAGVILDHDGVSFAAYLATQGCVVIRDTPFRPENLPAFEVLEMPIYP